MRSLKRLINNVTDTARQISTIYTTLQKPRVKGRKDLESDCQNLVKKLNKAYKRFHFKETVIEEFLDKEEDIITKPLYGNGGEGIHRFDKSNFNSKILEEYLHLPIMVQKFINEIEHGDRRIVFFDGEYFGSVARIPQEGNLKANFHAGGKASKTDLVYRDKEIIENLGPKLKEHNLFFVGIDIIGNYLTEINVTSPTGLKQINALNNVKLEKDFWDKLEAKYKLV